MIDIKNERNLTMLTDFYELTMANGYLHKGMQDRQVVFDMFFRRIPDGGGYAIVAGLEQLMQYLDNLQFSEEDLAFLRSKNTFSEEFLDYLRRFKFTCDVWAIKEGTPVYPQEPLVVVKGPVIQAQLVETMVLLSLNYQSLIATKSTRMNRVARGAGHHGIWLPPRAKLRRRDAWRPRGLYRRMHFDCLRHCRPVL